jgi:hypothetical protein
MELEKDMESKHLKTEIIMLEIIDQINLMVKDIINGQTVLFIKDYF